MKNSFNIQKVFYTIFLVAALVLLVPAMSYISVAFGWTNPPCNPPDCNGGIFVDSSTGNVGIAALTASTTLTVNGIISAVGHKIVDVAMPTAGKDAVNLDYLQAQVSGNGAGSLVLYGIGYRPGSLPTAPGAGTPACPAGYVDLLTSPNYSQNPARGTMAGGYGPHSVMLGWGRYDSDHDGLEDWNQDPPTEAHTPGAVSISYSICSSEPDHGVFTQGMTANLTQPLGLKASACVTNIIGGAYITQCNTCRICGKSGGLQ